MRHGPYGRGNLYHLLSNPIYIGKIKHRSEIHEGEHEAIIDEKTYQKVQALLKENASHRTTATNRKHLHLLDGLVFDETGDKLVPTYAQNHGKRYRYYVSSRRLKKNRSRTSDRQKEREGRGDKPTQSDGTIHDEKINQRKVRTNSTTYPFPPPPLRTTRAGASQRTSLSGPSTRRLSLSSRTLDR